MRGSQRSNTRVFHIPYYMWLVILASIIIGFDLFTSVRSASNTDTTSLNEADSIRQMGLVNNNNVKIIERYITEENADLGMDKPPRPWADSYRRILDVDNDWLKAEGNIIKALYQANYIPLDIFVSDFKQNKLVAMKIRYTDKQLTISAKTWTNYTNGQTKEVIDKLSPPTGFSFAVITANTNEQSNNDYPIIRKNVETKIIPINNQRLATIYLLPDANNRKANDADYMGYLVKYSQYQKAEAGADNRGRATKVQERYRKGRPTTETLAGTFSIETNSQQRNKEISKVEESIASTQSNSSSTSNSFSTSASNTMSAEGGFGPVKAKASTTIGISNTKESSQKNSTSASQNSGTSNQTTNEGSSGQASRNTFQTTTTVNYDGKETEIVTQLQQRAGKTYQPSEYIDTWLQASNAYMQVFFGSFMTSQLKPYVVSSVEEVGDYTLTASRANIINTLIRNEKQFSLVLDILASKFKQVVQKDPSFQQQLDVISGVRDALADGYYFQLVETLSDHWGGYQYSLGKDLSMGNLSSYDYALEHMLNDTIAKNMNKWSRAVRSNYLPLDLLAIMGLADKYSTEAINATGILKIEE